MSLKLLRILLIVTISLSHTCIGPQDSIYHGPVSRRFLLSRSASLSPLRITFQEYNLSLPDSSTASISSLLSSVSSFFSLALTTYSVSGNLLLSEITSCGSEVIIPEFHQTYGLSNTDIVIYITSNSLQGQNYLAYSGSCAVDSTTGAVYAGRVVINYQNYEKSDYETKLNVLIHEVTHILGFSSSLMKYWKKSGVAYLDSELTKTVTLRGVTKTLLVTPNVQLKVQENCASLEGAELEDQGGTSTSLSHWEMRTFFNDLMISHVITDVVYSDITLALLKDTGWYGVNYTMGQSIVFGKSAGCTFHTSKCILDSSLNNYFCSNSQTNTCDFFALQKAYCNVATFTKELQAGYQYFSGFPKRGGADLYTDYCPYKQSISYGACRGNSQSIVADSSRGESISIKSRCLLSTLSSTGSSKSQSAVCYESSSCDSTKMTLNVNNNLIECTYGSTVTVPGFTGSITCPAYNDVCGDIPCKALCSGLGACVNGFCVCKSGYSGDYCNIICGDYCAQCTESACLVCTKVSMVVNGKDCVCDTGYILDYTGKCVSDSSSCDLLCTTCVAGVCQLCTDFAEYNNAKDLCTCQEGYYDAGEGFCESCKDYCKSCESEQCSVCDDNAELQTDGSCECSSGYYENSGECKPCFSNCVYCTKSTECTVCKDGYYLKSGKCSTCENNCETCEDASVCLTCNNDYYLYKRTCISECPAKFYAKDKICFSCSIAFCDLCDQTGICSQCSIGYTLTQGTCLFTCPDGCDKCTFSGYCTQCSLGHYLLLGICYPCSSNCKSCTSSDICLECMENYKLKNSACVVDCEDNCKKCSERSQCNACESGFYLDTKCKQCPTGCYDCVNSKKCRHCISGFNLVNSICLPACPMNCASCKDGECFKCDTGYLLKEKKCQALCQNFCVTCDFVGKCLTCEIGYFLNKAGCTKCDEGCQICLSLGECLQCRSDLVLKNGKCN